MAKLIFHVDVNSAFLSWEAARRVANGEPDIRMIPSVIGGDREKRTGVVLAKSIPSSISSFNSSSLLSPENNFTSSPKLCSSLINTLKLSGPGSVSFVPKVAPP